MNSTLRCIAILSILILFIPVSTTRAEVEPNNTPAQATILGPNGSDSGAMDVTTDQADWWSVTIPADGALIVSTLSATPIEIDNYIYDQNGINQIAGYLHGGTQPEDTTQAMNLKAGTYFIRSYCYSGAGSYTITARFIATQYENDGEPNDSAGAAMPFNPNTWTVGHLGFFGNQNTDLNDWRIITIPADGKLAVATYSDPTIEIDNSIIDPIGWVTLASYKYGGSSRIDTSEYLNLAAGTYYIRTYAYSGYGSYTISNTFTPSAQPNDVEPNDSAKHAIAIAPGSGGTGHLGYARSGYQDGVDWRKITTTADGKLVMATYSDPTIEIDNSIIDTDMITTLASYKYGGSHLEDTSEVLNLGPGTYYIRTSDYSGYGSYTYQTIFVPTPLENDAEPNNSIAEAIPLGLDVRKTGHLGYYRSGSVDRDDYYSIILSSAPDTLFVRTDNNYALDIDMTLYTSDGASVGYGGRTGNWELLAVPGLAAGTYYVDVKDYNNYGAYSIIASTHRPAGIDVDVKQDIAAVPAEFTLRQNYPNPFNPSTVISYSIPRQSFVSLRIYDMLGREISTLVNEQKGPGEYTVSFNAQRLASGIYFYVLQAGQFHETKRMVLVR